MAQLQNTMSFTSMGFKGGATANGVPIEGQGQVVQTRGGQFSTAAGNDGLEAYFGYVVSADVASPNLFLAGKVGAVPAGIVMFDPSIAQNDPFKNNYYLKGTPMTVVIGGLLRFSTWNKTAVGSAEPTIGGKVIYSDATGEIQFLAAATAVPANWTLLVINGRTAQVVEVDAKNGVAIML